MTPPRTAPPPPTPMPAIQRAAIYCGVVGLALFGIVGTLSVVDMFPDRLGILLLIAASDLVAAFLMEILLRHTIQREIAALAWQSEREKAEVRSVIEAGVANRAMLEDLTREMAKSTIAAEAFRAEVREAVARAGLDGSGHTSRLDRPAPHAHDFPLGRGRAAVFPALPPTTGEATIGLEPKGDGEHPVVTAYNRGRVDEREALNGLGQPNLRIIEN